MTARKAFGAALIGASLCSVVGAAYLAWGTAGALFVGGMGLYVAGYTIYTGAEHEARRVKYRNIHNRPNLN